MREFNFRDDAARAKAAAAKAARPLGSPGQSLFYTEGFRLKVWPILFILFLGFFIPLLGEVAVLVVQHFNVLPDRPMMPWIGYYYQHTAQLLFTLLFMLLLRPFLRGADYGLHRPSGQSYVIPAILWGLAFGVIMTLADHLPTILAHKPPDGPYELSPVNVVGWLSFEGIYVGPTEEPLFRGLLVTFLAAIMPGKVGFGRYSMNGAGVVVALVFALAHFGNFFIQPFWMALSQHLYAFALGVLYAYWFEKSKSLLAPIVGHNVSDVTEYILVFAMVAMWS